jgi:hypothetical protein
MVSKKATLNFWTVSSWKVYGTVLHVELAERQSTSEDAVDYADLVVENSSSSQRCSRHKQMKPHTTNRPSRNGGFRIQK